MIIILINHPILDRSVEHLYTQIFRAPMAARIIMVGSSLPETRFSRCPDTRENRFVCLTLKFVKTDFPGRFFSGIDGTIGPSGKNKIHRSLRRRQSNRLSWPLYVYNEPLYTYNPSEPQIRLLVSTQILGFCLYGLGNFCNRSWL